MSRDTEADGKSPLPDWDAVIATRNRAEALAISVPLLLAQTVPPRRLIVVDASDDHGPVADAVSRATSGWNGTVILEHSARGSSRQRNLGLAHVTAPVVVFPDDDSLLYPDAAEELLKVYARDTERRIAGVAAGEAMAPPPGALPESAYRMSGAHDREAKTRLWRYYLSRRLTVLKPALKLGQVLNARHPVPDWLAEMDAKPTEYMTGFRMSFRTEAIRASGFDETLGGYALDEDVDASLSAMRQGLVVGARRARIYHHRFPAAAATAAPWARSRC